MNPYVAFLLQLALILGMARLLGDLMRRLNQPAVLGELAAGIILGPSFLGWMFPDAFKFVFQAHLADPNIVNFYKSMKQSVPNPLDTISAVGLVLLMLLTGLETDIRVMRNMGRAAFMASVFGMVIPFGTGLLLGMGLDERYVPDSGRLPLVLFMATAMAISAMPVIAKILIDLNMLKRNFGMVILSAAVVDDTIGWIILAMISGLVTTGVVNSMQVLITLAWLIGFLAVAAFVLYPLLNWSLLRAEQTLKSGGELVVVVVVALLCAAATEAIHVHAVFGAFIAGVILRQCTGLSRENLQRLETVVMALFAPLFFGSVGLRVDLTQLSSVWIPLIVIAIAVSGKIVGCFIGGLVGKMPPWEAFALGCGMSARGAMELVVAKVGLELGILNAELFSSVVLMALVTSVLAPLMLKAIAHKLPMSDEEKLRERGTAGGFVPTGNLKVLVPAGGGKNAVIGCHFATQLCASTNDRVTALHVEGKAANFWKRLSSKSQRLNAAETDTYFIRLQAAAGANASKLQMRKLQPQGTVLQTILSEAGKGYQFLFIGAAGQKHPLYDPFVSEVVKGAPCHLVIVSDRRETGWEPAPFKDILVPINGSYFSDAAFELAAAYAATSGANVTVLYIAEGRKRNPLLPAAAVDDVSEHVQDLMRVTLKEQLREKMKHPENLECHVRESESVLSGLTEEFQRGKYDLVVLGAENKSLVERLYLGQHMEEALTEIPCPVTLVIPKVGFAGK